MAAGQRKYFNRTVRFSKESGVISAVAEFSWGIEETDGTVKDRRGNTTTFTQAELVALLTQQEITGLQGILAKIQTATKTKATELANAVEE